eukprot:751683-Hanusia_phi.AAC.2
MKTIRFHSAAKKATSLAGRNLVGEGVLREDPVRDVLDRDGLGQGMGTDTHTGNPIMILVNLGALRVIEIPDGLLEPIIFQVPAKYVVPVGRASAVLNRECTCKKLRRSQDNNARERRREENTERVVRLKNMMQRRRCRGEGADVFRSMS